MDFLYEINDFVPREFCESIITKFEIDKERQQKGTTVNGLAEHMKKSTDIVIPVDGDGIWDDVAVKIMKYQKIATQKYIEYLRLKYGHVYGPMFNDCNFTIPRIQKTVAGGYYQWHIDTTIPLNSRVFACIIYLNNVEEMWGGATEFLHRKVQPSTGKLIIFPSSWEYLHRGALLTDGQKYIITSFLEFEH